MENSHRWVLKTKTSLSAAMKGGRRKIPGGILPLFLALILSIFLSALSPCPASAQVSYGTVKFLENSVSFSEDSGAISVKYEIFSTFNDPFFSVTGNISYVEGPGQGASAARINVDYKPITPNNFTIEYPSPVFSRIEEISVELIDNCKLDGDRVFRVELGEFIVDYGDFDIPLDNDPNFNSIEIRINDKDQILEVTWLPGNSEGFPGETLTGVIKVAGGSPPYSPTSGIGAEITPISGEPGAYDYKYTIPAGAETGALSDAVSVADSCDEQPQTKQINVPLKVLELTEFQVSPSSFSTQGAAGDMVEKGFSVSGGISPYIIEISGDGAVDKDSLSAPGIFLYSFSIPTQPTKPVYTATITVKDGDPNSSPIQIPVSIDVKTETLKVLPSEFVYEAGPGEKVEKTFDVSGGIPPYIIETSGDGAVDKSSLSGPGVFLYSLAVPAQSAKPVYNATITVKDGDPNSSPVQIPVTIKVRVAEDLALTCDNQNLSGTVLQKVSAEIKISGGVEPYKAEILEGVGVVTVSGSTATYTFSIPGDAKVDQKFFGIVKVIDAAGNIESMKIETTVALFNPITGSLTLTANEKAVAETVEVICPILNELESPTSGQELLKDRCNSMVANAESDPDGVENALNQITPEEAGTQATLTTKTAAQQMSNVVGRLFALRAGATGFSTSGLSFGIPGETQVASLVSDILASAVTGNAAGSDTVELPPNLGIFINGKFNFGNRDTTANQLGFDFDTLGATAGVDYRFTSDLVLGIAGGYADTGVDYNRDGGDLDIDAWSVSLYGNYYMIENLYLDAIVNVGWNDYDQTRKVSYTIQGDAPVAGRHDSDYSGDQYSITVGAGYEFDLEALQVTLNGRMSYLDLEVDGYREKDPNNTGLNLNIRDQDTDSFTATLGLQVSYVFNTDIGVFIPKMAAEWEHEFSDDSYLIEGSFVNDPNPAAPSVFAVETDDPTRDYFRLSPGFSMVFPHGFSGFVNFDLLLGYKDFESYNLSFGMRYEF